MKIKVPYVYKANVIMPRKRKPIEVLVEDSIFVEVKEYSKDDAPVAFRAEGRDLPFGIKSDIRFDGNRLWELSQKRKYENGSYVYKNNELVLESTTIDIVKQNTESKGENYPWSSGDITAPFFDFWWDGKYANKVYTKNELEQNIRIWESDNKKDIVKKIKETAKNIISIDSDIYNPTKEPRYIVMTFGLGGNHGGTSLTQTRSSKATLERFEFTALEYEKALQYAMDTATNRGDNESIEHIKHACNKIDVLIPEAVKSGR
jgi:hypothetical protein